MRLQPGDVVKVGRQDEEYPGWIWATRQNGNSGWVHESLLRIEGAQGIALREYDATEVDVSAGEVVEIREEIGGWCRVSTADGRVGWAPTSHLEPL